MATVFSDSCAEVTVRQLNAETGISTGRVSALLNGEAKWYVDDVAQFAAACSISVREAVERAETIVMQSDDLSARRARKPRSRQVPVRDAARTGDRDEGEQHP